MAWLTVDKDGTENIFQFRPKKTEKFYTPLYTYSMWLTIPKGSIKKLIGHELTWEDEPVKIDDEK